jgi:hypothetical protein
MCNQYEYLYYPYCETRTIKDLFSYQDSLKEKSIGALTIDCFFEGVNNLELNRPQALSHSGARFISAGYLIERDEAHDAFSCSGALRDEQIVGGMDRELARTAATKWRRHYSTRLNAKRIVPKQRNHVMSSSKIHIAFISLEFWYKSNQLACLASDQLKRVRAISAPLRHWSQLAQYGLMNLGEWSK